MDTFLSEALLETKHPLSLQGRYALFAALSALPLSQLLKLEFSLCVPSDVMPGLDTPLGERSAVLLRWVESPQGPGINTLISVLKEVVIGHKKDEQNTDEPTDTYSIKVTLDGNFSELDREDILHLVQLFQAKASDSSVQIHRCREGSIEIDLHGSKESLELLKSLIESGDIKIQGLEVKQVTSPEKVRIREPFSQFELIRMAEIEQKPPVRMAVIIPGTIESDSTPKEKQLKLFKQLLARIEQEQGNLRQKE